MSTKGVATAVTYWAVNTTTGNTVAADQANHTLTWAKDGAAPAEVAGTTPACNNGDGSYTYILTAGEATCNSGQIVGTSSTSNVAIRGVAYTFEDPVTALTGSATYLTAIALAVWSIATTTVIALASTTWGNWVWTKLGYITGNIALQVQSLISNGSVDVAYQGQPHTINFPLPSTVFNLTGFTVVEYTLVLMPNATANVPPTTPTLMYEMAVLNVGNAVTQGLQLIITSTDTAKFFLSPWPFNKYQTDPRQSYAYRWTITAYADVNCATNSVMLAQGYLDVEPGDATGCT